MAETMYAAPASGLAATQVDVHKAHHRHRRQRSARRPQRLHQPGDRRRRRRARARRGLPVGTRATTTRSGAPRGSPCARSGRARRALRAVVPTGLLAVCIQHEMDHLDRQGLRRLPVAAQARAACGKARGRSDRGLTAGPMRDRVRRDAGVRRDGTGRRSSTRRLTQSRVVLDAARPRPRPRLASRRRCAVKTLARRASASRVLQPRNLKTSSERAPRPPSRSTYWSSRRTALILPAVRSSSSRATAAHQHPRVAAAALARRGADPARAARGRHARPASASCRWTQGLDTGPVIAQPMPCRSRARETAGTLHDKSRCGRRARRSSRLCASCERRAARRGGPSATRARRYAAKIDPPRPSSTGARERVTIDRGGSRVRSGARRADDVGRRDAQDLGGEPAAGPFRRARRRRSRRGSRASGRLRRRRAQRDANCSAPAASECPRAAFLAGHERSRLGTRLGGRS